MDQYLKNWIFKATEDLRAAEHELRLDYNIYSVDVRYPDEFYIPTIEEAREIYSTANQFKDFVLGKVL